MRSMNLQFIYTIDCSTATGSAHCISNRYYKYNFVCVQGLDTIACRLLVEILRIHIHCVRSCTLHSRQQCILHVCLYARYILQVK